MDDLIFNRDSPNCYYNATDLNRVEKWCEYLADLLNSYSYPVNITVKTDWLMVLDENEDRIEELENVFPTEAEMERIRSNVNTLKTAFYSFTNVPANLDYMTYQKANDIEKILSEIDTLINNMVNVFRSSGTFFAGEEQYLLC